VDEGLAELTAAGLRQPGASNWTTINPALKRRFIDTGVGLASNSTGIVPLGTS
jgi:hypothetical protein